MGCGSSSHVVPADQRNNVDEKNNGNGVNANGNHHSDDLPTVVLPETPAKPKPREYYAIFQTLRQLCLS